MRIVVALGGNALLRRGEPPTAEVQRRNAALAAAALAPLTELHELAITHGNGPQVGLLALYSPPATPFDILDAETEGMIGYLIQQELANRLPETPCVSLTTRVEVAADDPAFAAPSKPIGPVYGEDEAKALARQHGWSIARDGDGWRRTVPSPQPLKILELDPIRLLVENQVLVICAGGGGIPVVRDDGGYRGIEAVIDKDLSSALLARALGAEMLLMLTDVAAVYADWRRPNARALRRVAPERLADWRFEAGSMAPKVAAAIDFVTRTKGVAAIGRLEEAGAILAGEAGTTVVRGAATAWWD